VAEEQADGEPGIVTRGDAGVSRDQMMAQARNNLRKFEDMGAFIHSATYGGSETRLEMAGLGTTSKLTVGLPVSETITTATSVQRLPVSTSC
jgi:hypothetical protein